MSENENWDQVESNDYENLERYYFEEIGEELIGTLVDVFNAKHGLGLTIEKSEDSAVIHYPNSILKDLIKSCSGSLVGYKIKIVYSGDIEKPNKENDLKNFELYVKR